MTYIPVPTGLLWILLVLAIYILAQVVLARIKR